MPIIFVHGVANRIENSDYEIGLESIGHFLREYVCPVVSKGKEVEIIPSYWGGEAAQFAWNRSSCPVTRLLGMGSRDGEDTIEKALLVASNEELRAQINAPLSVNHGELLTQGVSEEADTCLPLDLQTLDGDQISDLVATLIAHQSQMSEAVKVEWIMAADDVAHESRFLSGLVNQRTAERQANWFNDCLQTRLEQRQSKIDGGLLAQGHLDQFCDSLTETLDRAGSMTGSVMTHFLAEKRATLNAKVTLFLGDIFTYLNTRLNTDKTPGVIPQTILSDLRKARKLQLERNGEPLIVITHSMGGQIIYDMVTTFLPAIYQAEGIRVDFWCATASQVALFEEMKLFLCSSNQYSSSSGRKVPHPPLETLGAWWNVWDPADFISFTAKDIFEDVRDECYKSGLSVLSAHGGYLKRPSFYRLLAKRIEESRTKGWKW